MSKKLAFIVAAASLTLTGAGSAKPLGPYVIEMDPDVSVVADLSECRYTLDRIEQGNGSDWAVIEISTPDGSIYMVDVEIQMYQYPY